MKRNWWVGAVIVVLTLVAGCKSNGTSQNSTDMRVLNAVIDAEALDVLVDDDVKHAAIALGATTGYVEFSSGSRGVKVRSSTQGTVLSDKSVSFGSGTDNTLVLYGKRGAIGSLLLSDDTGNPSSGKFKVRVLGLSPDAGAVDLYLTSGDISATPATLATVAYGTQTDYVEVSPGSLRIAFAIAGTKDVIFQSGPREFADGAKVTVVVFPAVGGKLVNAVVMTPGDGGGGTFLPNPLGRLKAVNAVPDSPGLTFKADGTTLLSSVPFGGSSSYVTATAGARTLQLEAANVPGVAIASLAKTIDPARDYTAVAVNTLGQAQLVAFDDDNTFAAAGFAKLRFANAMVGSGSVDVLVNFASQYAGLAFGGVSPYYAVAAGDDYTISFATAGGVSVIAALSPVDLDASAVYTLYLMGASGNPQAKVVRDR